MAGNLTYLIGKLLLVKLQSAEKKHKNLFQIIQISYVLTNTSVTF